MPKRPRVPGHAVTVTVPTRLLTTLLITLVTTVVLVLTGGGAAWAHATLVSTSPGQGAVLRGPLHARLSQVTATFDEVVGVSPDSLRVFGPDGRRVDEGPTRTGSGPEQIRVLLPAGLPDGTYTVAWHVVSADSHPVQGAFTFSLGHPSSHVAGSAVQAHGSGPVQVVYVVVRGLSYLGYALLAGGLVFCAVCWPRGPLERRTRRLLVTGWWVSVATAVLGLLVQGVFAADRTLRDLFDPHLVGATLGTNVGTATLARLVLLAFAAGLGLVLLTTAEAEDRETRRGASWVCLLFAVLLAATWSMTGHASVGRDWGLSLLADDLHLTAMAVWLGGLAMLFAVVLREGRPGSEGGRLRAVVSFSGIAGWCVPTLVVTGTFQAWRNVRHWAALLDSSYGWLLLAKVAGLVLLVALGYAARQSLGRPPVRRVRRSSAPAIDLLALRRGVTVEVVIVVAVLAVTAVLVQTPTALESYHPIVTASRPFSSGSRHGTVSVRVDPARLGANTVRILTTTASGTPYRPAQLTASLSLADQHLGPLALAVRRVGDGSYRTRPTSLAVAGTWTLSVVIRSGPFDETTVVVPVPIG
ncbi:MAG: copper resistance CopC/CopD family protein [Nocardioidaceae bacterium]